MHILNISQPTCSQASRATESCMTHSLASGRVTLETMTAAVGSSTMLACLLRLPQRSAVLGLLLPTIVRA